MGDEEGTECISILLSEPIAGGKLVAHFIKFPAFVLPQRSLPYSVLVANPNNSIVHLYHMPLLNFLPSLSLSPHSHWCLLKWFPKDTTPNQVFISSSVLGRTQAKPNNAQRGLACYDSWGRKESDMTEHLIWTDRVLGPQHMNLGRWNKIYFVAYHQGTCGITFISVQLLSRVQLLVTPWTAAC